MTTVQPDETYNLKLTGRDLQIIALGLGEIPHKLAGPLEVKMADQIEAQQKDRNA